MQTADEAGRARALLVCVCGLPAAGKTTLAAALTELARLDGVDAHHLCLDEMLARQTSSGEHGDFCPATWRASRREMHVRVEELLRRRREEVAEGPPLLLLADDVHHLRSMRYQLLQLARASGAAFMQLFVRCDLQEALARNAARAACCTVPVHVLARLASALQPPVLRGAGWEAHCSLAVECGPDEHSLHTRWLLQGAPADAAAVWRAVRSAWGAPAAAAAVTAQELAQAAADRSAAGRAASAASIVHAFDATSRSMLAVALSGGAQSVRDGPALNALRRRLLKQLRSSRHQQGTESAALLCDSLLREFAAACASDRLGVP